jgi:hypothetical protein
MASMGPKRGQKRRAREANPPRLAPHLISSSKDASANYRSDAGTLGNSGKARSGTLCKRDWSVSGKEGWAIRPDKSGDMGGIAIIGVGRTPPLAGRRMRSRRCTTIEFGLADFDQAVPQSSLGTKLSPNRFRRIGGALTSIPRNPTLSVIRRSPVSLPNTC